MSLKGTLDALGLEDLLRADLASQGAGRLTLRNGAHYAALEVSADGVRILVPDLLDAEPILKTFVERGLVDPERLAKRRRHHLADILLLDALIEEGAIPESELLEMLAAEVEDTILDLMLWSDGRFHFDTGKIAPRERGLLGRICVDPEGVCERAQTRIDDRRAIGDQLGDHALLFFPIAGELPASRGTGDLRQAIYACLDGHIVTHELALQLGVGRYDVLRALAQLAADGLVRPASPEELNQEATLRGDAGNHRVARALVLQWAELEPDRKGPLKKLAALAVVSRDKQAEVEALCTLGHQHLQKGEVHEALEQFQRAMRKAGGDEVVVQGLKLAAEAAGDNDTVVDGTVILAQSKLDEGDSLAALELLAPLLTTHADNMAVQLLRARALVNLEKRTELLEQAEAVGMVLGRDGCQTQVDREAAEFFREAIETVAPDRGDLLERFRALYDPRRARRRRRAIVCATLLLLCSAGVYLWPASASSLLAQAEEAADAGDTQRASMLLGQLTSRFPEAPEIEQATLLRNRLFPPHGQAPRRVQAERALKKEIAGRIPALRESLTLLPAVSAQRELRTVLDSLESATAKDIRRGALNEASDDMRVACARLLKEIVARVKLLAQTAGIHERLRGDANQLRTFLEEAEAQRDPMWLANVKATAELIYRIGKLNGGAELGTSTRDLGRGVVSLEKAAEFYDEHARIARITLATLELEEADRLCREDAPRLMVGGGLEQADAHYRRLEVLLAKYGNDETYADIIETMNRRRIPKFITDRRAQIADIRARLQKARVAEERGALDEAVRIYAELIKQYWLIRFENVFTLPLQVDTIPPGLTVTVDGEPAGRSPTIVRYTWGSDASVQVSAPGWTPATQALHTAEAVPPHSLELRLTPAPIWRAPRSRRGFAGALRVGRDVLRVARSGAVTLHDAQTGAAAWQVGSDSLEGVRGRPALAAGLLYVARVDGKVLVLDPAAESRLTATLDTPRPVGDMAAQSDVAALATSDGLVLGFRAGQQAFSVEIGAVPTAGLLGAHGAFWVGTASGEVVRVDAASQERTRIRVAGSNVPVAGFVGTEDGVLVTTANGRLVALDAHGGSRWEREHVADFATAPTRTKSHVAVADRAGHIHLFDPESGASRGTLELGGRIGACLLGSGDTLLAGCEDGRLWAYDLAASQLLVDAPMGLDASIPVTLLDGGQVALATTDGAFLVIDLPKLP